LEAYSACEAIGIGKKILLQIRKWYGIPRWPSRNFSFNKKLTTNSIAQQRLYYINVCKQTDVTMTSILEKAHEISQKNLNVEILGHCVSKSPQKAAFEGVVFLPVTSFQGMSVDQPPIIDTQDNFFDDFTEQDWAEWDRMFEVEATLDQLLEEQVLFFVLDRFKKNEINRHTHFNKKSLHHTHTTHMDVSEV
jgi:hypothetical protein